jgi:3',5'-cyclic AMP phosphodiesterase CpdA
VAERLLIQISDIHLTAGGELLPGVHPRANLCAGLAKLTDAGLEPDFFILTGDLADTGDPTCYQDLADIMKAAVDTTGAGVAYLPGNHDVHSEFRRHLLGLSPTSETINQVHWCGDHRVVCLDSVVLGEGFGALTDETLGFLRDTLATPAPGGTVLALHHPPIPSPIEPMSRLRLRQPESLADAISGSDVRLIVCGHNHHEALGAVASIPVWVSPAVAYRMDVLTRQEFHKLAGSAFSQIVIDDNEVTVTVIPVPLDGSMSSS